MPTITMLIRNVHGTLPPHGGIQRSYRLCTYPIVIRGGNSIRHMGQSACATNTMTLGIFPGYNTPGMILEHRSLGHISPRKNILASHLEKMPWGYSQGNSPPEKPPGHKYPGCMARTISILGCFPVKIILTYFLDIFPGHIFLDINHGHKFLDITLLGIDPRDLFLDKLLGHIFLGICRG